jgi:hypothetical protein
MFNMNLSRNLTFNYSFYDECKLFKIIICDKVKGRLFEATTDSIDDFIDAMIRLGYKNFLIKASGFFLADEYFCIVS